MTSYDSRNDHPKLVQIPAIKVMVSNKAALIQMSPARLESPIHLHFCSTEYKIKVSCDLLRFNNSVEWHKKFNTVVY